jgi:hypothetical protein
MSQYAPWVIHVHESIQPSSNVVQRMSLLIQLVRHATKSATACEQHCQHPCICSTHRNHQQLELSTYEAQEGYTAGTDVKAARLDRPLGTGPLSWLLLTSKTAPTRVSVGTASAKASREPLRLFEAKLM